MTRTNEDRIYILAESALREQTAHIHDEWETLSYDHQIKALHLLRDNAQALLEYRQSNLAYLSEVTLDHDKALVNQGIPTLEECLDLFDQELRAMSN